MVGNFFSDKRAARRHFESLRRSLSFSEVSAAGALAAERAVAWVRGTTSRTVALFAAQPFELPTAPILGALQAHEIAVVFPRVRKGDRVLAWYRVTEWSQLEPGTIGLLEPRRELPEVNLADIECFIVPGVAFGRDGSRLGRGGGYYDATLAARRSGARTLGLGLDLSVVEALPVDAHDVFIEAICTPTQVIHCQNRSHNLLT